MSVLETEDEKLIQKNIEKSYDSDLEIAISDSFQKCATYIWHFNEKASLFSEKIGILDFNTTNVWLRIFKDRHRIQELHDTREKLSPDKKVTNEFVLIIEITN